VPSIFVVRVWLPDRPGALGAVASRIGAVRGDLVGIDILETGAGRAIDELVVSLPSDDLVPLLVKEIEQVDGVDVEDVRAAGGELPDARLAALETAAVLMEQPDRESLCAALVGHVRFDFEADWAAVLSAGDTPELLAAAGEAPPAAWLSAFVSGSRDASTGPHEQHGPDDVAWAPLSTSGAALAVGREGRVFRARERRQLVALARIAGWRLGAHA
jgi:hypothetical protein